jgi:hypothetical protein
MMTVQGSRGFIGSAGSEVQQVHKFIGFSFAAHDLNLRKPLNP